MDLLEQALSEETAIAALYFDASLFVATVAQLGESERVVSLLEGALKRAPTDPGIALRLAESLEQAGDQNQRVLELTRRAKRFTPLNPKTDGSPRESENDDATADSPHENASDA
jgi:hypothetical protein